MVSITWRLRDEKILPAVVVVIEQVRAPTGKSKSRAAHAGRVGHIPKGAVAVVAKKHVAFVGEIGDHDIGTAIIIVVAEIRAHAGEGLAILVVSNARQQPDFAERAVAVVVVEKTLHRIVGDEDVGEAIAVVVGERDAQSFAIGIGDAGFLGNVGEGAVSIVVIENVGRRRRSCRDDNRRDSPASVLRSSGWS